MHLAFLLPVARGPETVPHRACLLQLALQIAVAPPVRSFRKLHANGQHCTLATSERCTVTCRHMGDSSGVTNEACMLQVPYAP